ncbi:MAG TPA: eight-cysteine-cluster domain-containing protein [Candidatus Omnitrophota bacterium]|nr:eight-cysteine-cluster domain-containing protein [Candidatus Omnitrophota bacterium]
MPAKRSYFYLVVFIAAVVLSACVFGCTLRDKQLPNMPRTFETFTEPQLYYTQPEKRLATIEESKKFDPEGLIFCGYSTFSACNADKDCYVSGCSGQVCAGIKEEIITTCESKECFNKEKFSLRCGCFEGQCQFQ